MKLFSDGLRLRRWGRLCLRLIAAAVLGALLCSAVAEGAQVGGLTQALGDMPVADDVSLASTADAQGVRLYAIVSDMRGKRKSLLSDRRLFYEIVLMSVAIELQESGALRGISLCATQKQADGFQEIAGDPGDVALQLYCAMEAMESARDEISTNTWAAIERALDQSAEEGTRPVILLLYDDDIPKISAGDDLSEKANRAGAQIFYLQGERDVIFDGFEAALGVKPAKLSATAEEPAEDAPEEEAEAPAGGEPATKAEMFYAGCGTADVRKTEPMQKLVAAIVREVLGGERNVSPFRLVPRRKAGLSVEQKDRNSAEYSLFTEDLDSNIDVMLVNLGGVKEVVKTAPSVRADASLPGSTLLTVKLHSTQHVIGKSAAQDDIAAEESAAQDDIAPSDAANQTSDGEDAASDAPASAAGQMPVALDKPVDGADAESEPPVALDVPIDGADAESEQAEGEAESQGAAEGAPEDLPAEPTVAPDEPVDPNFIATVRGGKRIQCRGVLLHESQAVRTQMEAREVLEPLQSAQLIWPENGDNRLKLDFSAVDAALLELLDGGEYRASAHMFRDGVEVSAAEFNSRVASEPLAFAIDRAGAYRVRIAVAHAGVQVEGDVEGEYIRDNQKPRLLGGAELSLGTFVADQAGEVLETLDLAAYFADADANGALRYYVDVAPLASSLLTIRAGEEFGDASCIVQASDSIDFSNMLTISWTTRSARELLASAIFELSVSPAAIFKGTEGEITATATLAGANAVQNLDKLEAAWADVELTAKFVGLEEGSAELPDVTLTPAGRSGDGRMQWKGSFTAPTARSGNYDIELESGDLPLNEGASDALRVVNRAPLPKEGAPLEIEERPRDYEQAATKTLKLAELIDAEPNDVLRIQISSTGSPFTLNEETGLLEQQEGDGGGECGMITWNVAEQPDRSLTVSISRFNQPNRAKGALKLNVRDQEGEACDVEISYNVKNNRRIARILSIVVLAVAALALLGIALGSVYLIRKPKGPRR